MITLFRPVKWSAWQDWRLTQPFGTRPEVYGKMGFKWHMGLDYAWPRPWDIVPIYSATEGKCEVWYDEKWYGNYVKVRSVFDGVEYTLLYGHMSKVSVKTGDIVKPMQEIGQMGTTGFSSGVHLHFEIKDPREMNNGYKGRFDPLPFIQEWRAIESEKTDIQKAWETLPIEARGFAKYDDPRPITAWEARMLADIRYWRGGPTKTWWR